MIWWPHVVFAAALFLRVCRLNLARRLYASKVALWFQLDLKQVMIPTFQHDSCQHCSSFSLDHCHDTRPIWLCTFCRKNRTRPPLLPHPHTHTQALLYKPNLSNLNFDRFCGLHPFWPQCLCVSWCNVHSLCCSHGCCIATNYESMINFIRWDASTNMVRLAGQILPYRIHCHPVRKGECLSLQITYTQEVMNKSSTISTTIRVHHITTSG